MKKRKKIPPKRKFPKKFLTNKIILFGFFNKFFFGLFWKKKGFPFFLFSLLIFLLLIFYMHIVSHSFVHILVQTSFRMFFCSPFLFTLSSLPSLLSPSFILLCPCSLVSLPSRPSEFPPCDQTSLRLTFPFPSTLHIKLFDHCCCLSL